MARLGGIQMITAVEVSPEAPKVLIFTIFDHDEVAARRFGCGCVRRRRAVDSHRGICGGADGFLLKTASPDEICSGIRNLAGGLVRCLR